MRTVGSKIKELRQRMELTQEELARKANIPYATLLKIESDNVQNPTINTIQKLAEALEISIDDLMK